MKVVITGSRKLKDRWLFDVVIEGLYTRLTSENEALELAHGGCPSGADSFAESWKSVVAVTRFDAEWGRYGKAAGPIRNKKMLAEFQPNLVLAFFQSGAKNTGTTHCAREARAMGLRVVEVWCD